MCGIAGFLAPFDEPLLWRMTRALAHRGPDDEGVYLSSPGPDGRRAGLGARRLSILDLSAAGHMPMISSCGSYVIVHNGEIYNSPSLRQALKAEGVPFCSSSDTEVIRVLYEREGPAAFSRLNGMFACVIWDAPRRTLVLARDPFGVKPLYYTEFGGVFAFASEIKSLLLVPGFERTVDLEALSQYLTFLWVPEPATIFRGVRRLPPGCILECSAGAAPPKLTRFWEWAQPPADHRFGSDEPALIEEVRRRFVHAVGQQMLSDVPVGAFLSAGVDSSSVVAAMAATRPGRLQTFTITFPAQARRGELTLDDPAVARRTAAALGASHREIVVAPDVVDLLPRLVTQLDEPIADPALIMSYLLTREARHDVTVLLSGLGGDELFAGYRKHLAHGYALGYQRLPRALRRWIERAVAAVPTLRGTRLKGYVRLAKKMARSGSLAPIERFLTDATYVSEELKRELVHRDLRDRVLQYDPWSVHRRQFDRVKDADFLNRMLFVDATTFLPSLNLSYVDRTSMANALEVRVPFLDAELASWVAWHVPPGLKLRGRTTKYVFRKAVAGMVPGEVLAQRKAGFGAPIDRWLSGDLASLIGDLLAPRRLAARGLLEPAAVARLVDAHRRGYEDWSLQLWQLLTLELWMDSFQPSLPS